MIDFDKAKKTERDPPERLQEFLDGLTPALAATVLSIFVDLRAGLTLAGLEREISRGLTSQVVERVSRAAARRIETALVDAYVESGKATASSFMRGRLGISIDFDQTAQEVVGFVRQLRVDLVREITDQQRAAILEAITDGIQRGINPREVARTFRNTIGLTRKQVLAVNRYRAALEKGSVEALRRQLRDRRFDPTVQRAIASKEPLSREQVDRMVDRYRERFLQFRAETIARTEGLAAVQAGADQMYGQAIAEGAIDADALTTEWNTAKDERVRRSHAFMHGQKRKFGVPFLSGDGNLLRYPGDRFAPASDRVKCRCTRGVRVSLVGVLSGMR